MHDPFPLPPSQFLQGLVKAPAAKLGLTTLHLHIHELLLATFIYTFICTIVSPLLSTALFPKLYPNFPRRTRLNWDVHVVSLLQSLFINFAALWVMWVDDERKQMGWEERVWGYSGAGGMIQGFAAGYFLWDLGICFRYRSVFGLGLLAHAIAALVVFSFGFVSYQLSPSYFAIANLSLANGVHQRPFVNFYGPTFILYELSSPFLNFHWFFDKLQMTGSRAQWYNGILLLVSFFCCRLVWGTYQSVRVYQDVWAGLHYTSAQSATFLEGRRIFEPLGESDETMRYAEKMFVPPWLAFLYLGSNITLNTLNFYWFGKMIETIQKRFGESKEVKQKRWEGKFKNEGEPGVDSVLVEGLVDASTVVDSVLTTTASGTIVDADGEIQYQEKIEKGKVELSGNVLEVERKEIRRRHA